MIKFRLPTVSGWIWNYGQFLTPTKITPNSVKQHRLL